MLKKIIIADDDAGIIAALHMLLKSQGFEVSAVTTPDALVEQVTKQEFCAALIDLNYHDDTTSGNEGLTLISALKDIDENLPVIVMTGYSSIQIAVDAMKLGAADFVQKPWSNERLLHIIDTQIQRSNERHAIAKLSHENDLLRTQIHTHKSAIVAKSLIMQQILSQLEKLAQSDMSILLTGENGTGKSMFAEYLHQHSPRAPHPFIAVNMGAIADTLFESEMFGHVKGAFTDAKDKRIGRFELAEAGSIFLDEIANVSLSQQATLLRVLEERQFEKVGSSKTQNVDVRLISATNANIQNLVKTGDFRQDLLYRLNTVTINIPPLRERTDDIVPLAQAFLRQYANKYKLTIGTISEQANQALLAYSWPGNIRELGHIIERAMFLRKGDVIEKSDLGISQNHFPTPSNINSDENTNATPNNNVTLDEIEKEVIQARLLHFDHNPQKVAQSLGLSRSAYYRRLEKYKLL